MNRLEERDVNTNSSVESKWITGMLCISICCLMSVGVSASVPGLISYQGQLNDGTGAPVNATVAMKFSIYDVPSGGTALWTENQDVTVSNGVFNVQLGASQTIPAALFNNDALYLGVKVGADVEMAPRQMLTSNAYSFRAQMSVPIGTILPWHKSMAGTPALPDGWVECNGQVLADSGSPLNGNTMPNLNGDSRILIGANSSGESSAMDHTHPFSHWGSAEGVIQDLGGGEYTFGGFSVTPFSNPSAGPGNQRWNFRLEKVNVANTFSVVWIMRVK